MNIKILAAIGKRRLCFTRPCARLAALGPEIFMLRQSKRAFTLVEILMVVLILAIASAVIVPQIGSRSDLKVAAGARLVMSDLIWAQNRAITTQQQQFVVFGAQSYTLWYKNSSGTLL